MSQPNEELEVKSPPYFWWFILNLLAFSFALLSWMGCLHVFGNPEIPKHYEWLKKIKREPKLKRFKVSNVPKASPLNASDVATKFQSMQPEALKTFNRSLLKNYLFNFSENDSLQYIQGNFVIDKVRRAIHADFFQQGLIIQAQAFELNEKEEKVMLPVWIDFYMVLKHEDRAQAILKEGDLLELSKNPHFAAILNVSPYSNQRKLGYKLLVSPLVHGVYQITQNKAVEIRLPEKLNPSAIIK